MPGRDRRITAIACANGVSIGGSVFNLVALMTYVYDTTGESLPLGVAVLVSFLPVAVLTPILTGRLARFPQRRVAIWVAMAQGAIAVTMAALVGLETPLTFIYLCAAGLGLGAMMSRVALLTLIPRLVPRDQITPANIRFQMLTQLGAAAGATALVLQGRLAIWLLFTIDAITFFAAAFLLTVLLPESCEASGERSQSRPPVERVPLGASALWMPLVCAGYVAMNTLNAAIPLIVLVRLGAGQRGLATAEVVFPVAAISAALLARRARSLSLPVCVTLLTAGFTLLAFSDGLTPALGGVAILGAGVGLTNAAAQAGAQTRFPRALLSRVQGQSAALGAILSSLGVLGLSIAVDAGHGPAVLLAVAGYFAVLALAARAATRAAEAAPAANPAPLEAPK